MNEFLLQHKDIDVVIHPKFNEDEEKLTFKIQYDEKEINQLNIDKKEFEEEIKFLLGNY